MDQGALTILSTDCRSPLIGSETGPPLSRQLRVTSCSWGSSTLEAGRLLFGPGYAPDPGTLGGGEAFRGRFQGKEKEENRVDKLAGERKVSSEIQES